MTKPTKAQRRVLERMAAGDLLYEVHHTRGWSVSVFLGRGNPSAKENRVSLTTLYVMHRKYGWITRKTTTPGGGGSWVISPAGLAALTRSQP